MELSVVPNDFGCLLKVQTLSFSDWPDATSALKLTFENGEVYHECQADSDELSCAKALEEEYSLSRDVSGDLPWDRAINRPVRWLWQLTNQQGYNDGLQYSFANTEDDQEIIIQLVAIASHVEILEVGIDRREEK